MPEDTLALAVVRAWEAYAMINPRADDSRRIALCTFIKEFATTQKLDAQSLAVEGLKFLKRLDAGISQA